MTIGVPKPVARKKPDNWARAYGSPSRVRWICSLPSIISGMSPCVNAHTRNGGIGRKADYAFIVPLTQAEHDELHQHGVGTFERKYHVNLEQRARTIEAHWKLHLVPEVAK